MLIGTAILMLFYYVGLLVVKSLHVNFPPAIIGLILFSVSLLNGIVKEEWIKDVCDCLTKNMAMFLLPFMGALIVYKSMLMKNWLVILLVISLTTAVTITLTGLFVEYGLKYLRFEHMRKKHD